MRNRLAAPPLAPPRLLGAFVLGAILFSSSCGYRVAGRAVRLPSNWRTIAVPAFVNRTSTYRIEDRLTQAVIHELLARTSYRVIQNENVADAVLRGEVSRIEATPVLFDAATGRVTTVLITVRMKVRLTDRVAQKTVYRNNNFVFREEYQISTDVASFFEEQDPALERLARDFAADLVSNLLENF